jgi:isoquinoline 1-oxidoreductase alpha subunit
MALEFKINGKSEAIEVDPETPLLWVLRDHLGYTGTKFGCGIGQCGACTVHLDGQATRSCQISAADAAGQPIRTIEGLSPDSSHPLQKAWIEMNVPQCGYCQAGMIMAAAAMLETIPAPTDEDIDGLIDNICRCGTYTRIRAAIHKAAAEARKA